MGEIINKNTELVIVHGSENAPFVYILYADFLRIERDILGINIRQKQANIQVFHAYIYFYAIERDEN